MIKWEKHYTWIENVLSSSALSLPGYLTRDIFIEIILINSII